VSSVIVRGIDRSALQPVERNAFDILSNLSVAQFNQIKDILNLGVLGVLGPQTLAEFVARYSGQQPGLTDDNINTFKNNNGLGNTGPLHGVIGPQTAAAYFAAITTRSGAQRQINQAGIDLVKEFEGLVLVAAPDIVGVPTVGYGHTGPDVHNGMQITQAQAEALLRGDMTNSEQAVIRLVKVPLTDNQFAALVSLVFNVGPGALINTHLAEDLASGNMSAAADDFLRFNHAGGRVVAGLTRRRQAERVLFLTP